MTILRMEDALKTHELNANHKKLIVSVPYEKAMSGLQQKKEELVESIVVDETLK